MRRRGGPNVAIAFGPGGPRTAQLRVVESPGGPVSGGDRRKRDRSEFTSCNCATTTRYFSVKFFMSIYFKLLYIDNHSKDLLAEINFLVWRPYL